MAIGLTEYELEDESELESEYEDELESESELEGEGEWEAEGEGEWEAEGEGEWEAEGEGEWEAEGEYEDESEYEDEFQGEGEAEFEAEGEVNPVSKVYPDAMMEHLAHVATEAESEDEAAEGFLPLIPMVASKLLPLAARALPKLAGRALPKVARQVSRITPRLVRDVTKMTRVLHRNPQTRRLIRTIPSIARRAVTTIARQAAAGRPITPRLAGRILAHHRRRVLRNPMMVRRVLGRSNVMDRRYHRMSGLPTRAGWRYGRRPYVWGRPYGYRRGWRYPYGWRYGRRRPIGWKYGQWGPRGVVPRIAGPVSPASPVARPTTTTVGPYGYRRRGFGGLTPGWCPRCGTRAIPAPRGSVVVVR